MPLPNIASLRGTGTQDSEACTYNVYYSNCRLGEALKRKNTYIGYHSTEEAEY